MKITIAKTASVRTPNDPQSRTRARSSGCMGRRQRRHRGHHAAGLSGGGTELDDWNVFLRDDRFRFGHKVALTDLDEGRCHRPLRRDPSAIAVEPIGRKGGWVSMKIGSALPEAAGTFDEPSPGDPARRQHPWSRSKGYTFEGYRNADGTVVTQATSWPSPPACNAWSASPITWRSSAFKAELLPRYPNVDDVVALNHAYGCGVAINAPAAVVPIRTIRRYLVAQSEFRRRGPGARPGLREAVDRPCCMTGEDERALGQIVTLQDEALHRFRGHDRRHILAKPRKRSPGSG